MNIEYKINEVFEKKITECSFDSFDLDDGFLSKIDAEIKNKDKKNIKVPTEFSSNFHHREIEDSSMKNQNNSFRILQNSNESEPLDFNSKAAKTFTTCISPIHGSLLTKNTKNEFSSSTPVRKCLYSVDQNQDLGKESQESKYDYSEADLFEDWSNDNFSLLKDFEKNEEDLITLSQAVQIIEKESTRESESEVQDLDLSIDLLTGELMQRNLKNSNNCNGSQTESIKKSSKKPLKKHIECNKSLNLNFSDKEVPKKFLAENIYFSSDDENVFSEVCLTPKLYNKTLRVGKRNFAKLDSSSSDESFYFKKNRRKSINLIESDSSNNNLMHSFCQKRKPTKKKNLQGKQYIISEAEVDEEVSSDETEEDSEEYDKSFVDENSYCTQNSSANMTAKYLESIKNVGGGRGNFKIVKGKSYEPTNIFSQCPEENTDYEIDSFCVADFEDEVKTDLSDLEVAELILKIDEKKKKRKRALRKLKNK